MQACQLVLNLVIYWATVGPYLAAKPKCGSPEVVLGGNLFYRDLLRPAEYGPLLITLNLGGRGHSSHLYYIFYKHN